MRIEHSKIKIFTSTFLLFLLSFVVLSSSPASALEPSVNVEFVGGASQPYWQSSNGEAFHNTSLTVGNNVTYPNFTYIRVRNGSNQNYVVEGGSYVSLIGEVILRAHLASSSSSNTNIMSMASGYFGMSNDTSHTDCGMVDFKYDLQEYSQTTSPNEYYYRYTVEMICRVQSSGATNPTTNFNLATTGSGGSVLASFNLRRISIYQPIGEFNDSDIIAAINRVNATLNTVNGTLNTINGALGNIQNNTSDLLDSQNQANQDANDRYQDEKDTINNATSDAQDEVNNSDFSFGVPNTLDAFFRSFSDSNCVNIPNLATWLHSNETRVCSPWPLVVKNTMTPIVTGVFALVLTAFFVHWLKTNDSGGN